MAGAGTPAGQDAGAELRSVLLPDKTRPGRGVHKTKTIPDRSEIGAQITSFNFPNTSERRDSSSTTSLAFAAPVVARCRKGAQSDNRLDAFFVYAPEALHVEERMPSFHTGVANRSSGMNTPTR